AGYMTDAYSLSKNLLTRTAGPYMTLDRYGYKVFSCRIGILLLAFSVFKSSLALALPVQLLPNKEGRGAPPCDFSIETQANGFWEGTSATFIEEYFPKIPLRLTSPTLRALRDEVLKEKVEALLTDPSYQEKLFDLLVKSGDLVSAENFLVSSTLSDKENGFLNLFYWEGKPEKACEKVANLMRISPSLEIRAQNVYCLYLNGEKERAKIALELLNESDKTVQPLLNELFDPSVTPTFENAMGSSPFLLTLWCALQKEIPEKDLRTLPPVALVLIANTEKMPQETRHLAAELALEYGLTTRPDVQLPKRRELQNSAHVQELLEGRGEYGGKDLELLECAAKNKYKGEVLLLTLSLVGETPLKDIPSARLTSLLKALTKVGYDQQAKTLAAEYLMAKDL
ncbi:MAG: hypothetical protein K2Y08_03295, partial [Alphaproteobacteria bacterium]|nr:hypothetical protein [Alphaproteobacteria bacterium]